MGSSSDEGAQPAACPRAAAWTTGRWAPAACRSCVKEDLAFSIERRKLHAVAKLVLLECQTDFEDE